MFGFIKNMDVSEDAKLAYSASRTLLQCRWLKFLLYVSRKIGTAWGIPLATVGTIGVLEQGRRTSCSYRELWGP